VRSTRRPRRQCAKCPWRVSTDPREIPDGYSPDLHRGLSKTIAEPGSFAGFGQPMQVMACHHSAPGREETCVGWLAHQLGPGNNIALRLMEIMGHLDTDIETIGPQHETFEDTLPRDEA